MNGNLILLPDAESAAVMAMEAALAEPVLLFVVLGDGQKERDAAERAQFMAGGAQDPCKVVWAKHPAHVQSVLGQLPIGDGLDIDGREAVACSISLSREIRDVIRADEEPDFFRILRSLAEAMR